MYIQRAARIRPYLPTLISVAIMVFVVAQKHAGIIVILLLPIFALWSIYGVVAMVRKPAGRRNRLARIALWTLGFVLVGAMHLYWAHAARRDADAVVAAVLDHKARTGTYPETLGDVGIDKRGMPHKWMLIYALDKGRPMLIYAATATVFDMYSYDFEGREWKFRPD